MLIPYILWSLFYSCITIAQSIASSKPIQITTYLYDFLIGGAATPFYYIVCLLQFTILTPWLIKVIKYNGKMSRILWAVTPLYMVLLYIGYEIVPDMMESTLKGVIFPAWLLFYYLGLHIRISGGINSKVFNTISQFKIIAAAFVLECAEAIVVINIGLGSGLATSQLKISSILYSAAICLWLYKIALKNHCEENGAQKILHHIGDRSYGIFYIHCFILLFTRKFCSVIGLGDIWILNFIICFIMTALLSVLVIDNVNIIAGKLRIEKALKWIGFERSI